MARRSTHYGGHHLTEARFVAHRIQVDDIVLVALSTDMAGGTSDRVTVEHHCDRCRQTAYAGGYASPVFQPATPNQPADTYTSPKQSRQRFLDWLGRHLTCPVLCWNCQAELGDRCPSCSRSFTTGIPVDWNTTR